MFLNQSKFFVMYSSLEVLEDVLFSNLYYPYLYYGIFYKPSEFGSVMLSLLNSVDSFEKIINYMLLLQASYTTDIDFHSVHLLDNVTEKVYEDILCKDINKTLHHIISYELAYKMKIIAYYRHLDSPKLKFLSSIVIPIQNIILANLFVNVALTNIGDKDFDASIFSYITLLM